MLSKADDYPIHQSPEPIAYAGQSRNFYDRYFFNGYDIEGDVFFALGMGIYPHVDVIDAGFSLIRTLSLVYRRPSNRRPCACRGALCHCRTPPPAL